MRITLQRPTRRQPLVWFPVVFGLLVVLALALVALLVLAACTASARPGAGPAGHSPPADPAAARAASPSTAPAPTHPGRIRLRGRVVFASSRDQDPGGVSPCGDIFTVAADGSRLARLTDGPARDCQPSFAPDGRHILFSSDRAHPGGDSDLYVMNPDGSAITRLTHADSEEQEPTLMPCKGACP
jgi:hypothetical protein